MVRSYRSAVIPASVEQVWASLRDFDGLPVWHPGIASSEIEDGRRAGEVGCVRRLVTGDGDVIRERLMALDDVERSVEYEILAGPFPIRNYRAVMRAAPITDRGSALVERAFVEWAFVEWYADYDPETAGADAETDLEETFGDGVFARGLRGLRQRFEG